MSINFSNITLELVDLNVNVSPDLFINQKVVSFSKRILEDLGYPQFVQYCIDAPNKIFAIRACKGNELKASPFSKPKGEQQRNFASTNKNLRAVILSLIPNCDSKQRYKITGEYDSENRVMYFDMNTAEICTYFKNLTE